MAATKMTTNRPLCPTLVLLSLPALTTACFDSDEFLDDELAATEGSEDDTETGEPEQPTPDPDDPDEGAAEDPDIGVELAIDGSDLPPPLYSAARLALVAQVDGAQIDRVEFFRDGELIASDAEAPFEAEAIVENVDAWGLEDVLTFTAIAHDGEGHEGEGSVSLPVSLPDPGTIEWDELGPEVGERWLDLSVGADDAVFLTTQGAMFRVMSSGELVELYEFGVPATTATTSPDGGLIALGQAGPTTLMYHRFDAQGQSEYLGFLDDFGGLGYALGEATVGDNDRLIVSSVSPYAGENTARLSSLAHTVVLHADWHRYLVEDGQLSVAETSEIAVGPSGDIFSTATFAEEGDARRLQIRRSGQGGKTVWTHDHLDSTDARYADLVANEHGVFVAGRRAGQAVILRLSEDGELVSLLPVGGEEVVALAGVEDELVYASRYSEADPDGLEVGRLRLDGTPLWTTDTDDMGSSETARDVAVTSLGHVYVLGRIGQGQPRLQRFHP